LAYRLAVGAVELAVLVDVHAVEMAVRHRDRLRAGQVAHRVIAHVMRLARGERDPAGQRQRAKSRHHQSRRHNSPPPTLPV